MTHGNTLRIGTRGSLLALWQAQHVKSRIEASSPGTTCEIVKIKTTGDARTDVPLSRIGGKGLFTKEIESALLDGSVDLAVHSIKDMTTILPEGLLLGAVLEREDVRDVLLLPAGRSIEHLKELPRGARIGTSSLRRSAQLKALRPDLAIEDLRGNLDTRMRKLEDGQYDAIILAAAGMKRLGHADRISYFFPPGEMLPAVGQGAVGVEIRDADPRTAQAIAALEHTPTRTAVEAERHLLEMLEGGCQVPVGVYTIVPENGVELESAVFSLDGRRSARVRVAGPTSEVTAELAFAGLMEQGAGEILKAIRADS